MVDHTTSRISQQHVALFEFRLHFERFSSIVLSTSQRRVRTSTKSPAIGIDALSRIAPFPQANLERKAPRSFRAL
jgi:hypothetical protein